MPVERGESAGCVRNRGADSPAFARFLARSFIRGGGRAVREEIKPGKSPEARIAAFLRRLLSAGDILSAITTVFRRRRCRGCARPRAYRDRRA